MADAAEIIDIFKDKTLGCNKCMQQKPVCEFTKNNAKRRGYKYQCKSCDNENRRIVYSKVTISPDEKFTCKTCEETKFSTQFHKKSCGKFGLERNCKSCMEPARKIARNKFWDKNGGREGYKTDTWGFKKHYYGITKEQFFEMLASQQGSCAICLRVPQGEVSRVFHVDHNHETGKVRGLLCNICNLGLGKFKDSITSLKNAARYLEERGSYGS